MGPTVTWHCSSTQRFGMRWQQRYSGQWGQSWFLRETSTWTLRERMDGDLTRRLQWRWRRWGLRTSPHTSSRDGERGIDIRHHVRWWNRGGWWGPWRTTLFIPIVRSFRTWPSRTHGTTLAHYMVMACLRFASPRDQSYYLGRRIRLPIFLSRRQTRTQANNILWSLGALSQSKTNWRGITTHGFPSRHGELCMIFYMSPLQSNFTFFLFSPTILLQKNSSYQLLFIK